MKEQLQKDFDNSIKNLGLSQKDIEIKKFCLENFMDKGFPNRKEEDWKFSDLNQIIKNNIGELSFYNDHASTNKVDTSVFVDGLEHNKIVFINGRIEKIDFDYEKKNQIEIIDQSETIDRFNNNSLSDLNNAFTNKSFKVLIKKGYQLAKPLIIYHTTNSNILILFSSSWLNSIFSILPFIKTILLCSNPLINIEGLILFGNE